MARYKNDTCVASVFERADDRMYQNKKDLKAVDLGSSLSFILVVFVSSLHDHAGGANLETHPNNANQANLSDLWMRLLTE